MSFYRSNNSGVSLKSNNQVSPYGGRVSKITEKLATIQVHI